MVVVRQLCKCKNCLRFLVCRGKDGRLKMMGDVAPHHKKIIVHHIHYFVNDFDDDKEKDLIERNLRNLGPH